MATDSGPIIRKPRRNYPLPNNIRELDVPWPTQAFSRHTRVEIDREGYVSTDNPIVVRPGGYSSDLLSKL